MAFWKFGFHSQSAIDSILSSSAANQHHSHPNVAPSFPNLAMLDKLLDEDDLLQEIKAQHPKLVQFLGTREVVSRLLGYVSGIIFDDEEADRIAENSNSSLNRLSSPHPPTSSVQTHSSVAPVGYGGALLHSLRSTRVVGDTIGALLMDALDSEGRTPEDRAKAERRKIRYPYLSTEIIASDLWTVTSQIFSDPPRLQLLTRFWDAVLDQPPSATAAKSVQIGYWAKANIALINSKPTEMLAFMKSYPNLIPKLLAHFDSSPIVDVLMRIIQSEQTSQGIIDWLIDSTDFVELIISLLHPSRSSELHRTVADFLKDVIAFCTNQAASNTNPMTVPTKVVSTGSPPGSENSSTSPSSPDLARPNPVSASPSTQPCGNSDEAPKFITTRLMRELSSPAVISKLLSFGLDTPYSEDDDVITSSTLSSSLISSLSIIIDLIRRNNSDFSEHQLMVYFRDYPPAERTESQDRKPLSENAPRVVPLVGLLNSIGDRLGDLQALIKSPRSSTKCKPMVVGLTVPLTQERFRIVELYAELLHCSNMALVNRLSSEQRPQYDDDGALVSDLESLFAIFGANEEFVDLHDSNPSNDVTTPEASQASVQISPGPTTTDSSNEKVVEIIVNNKEEMNSETKQGNVNHSSSPETKQPPTSSQSSSSDEVPAGVRMKELFLEHKILDSCLDLFFEFPWNNFLHNVIYDIIQQTLNAKFSTLISGQASLKLAKSFFNDTNVIDRLLNGLDANHQYQSKSHNGRLGNMGHLVLIGDEVLKLLEMNSQEFSEVIAKLEKNEQWQEFVRTQIFEAREHAKLPLGGVMPVMSSTIEPQVTSMESEDKSTSVPTASNNSTTSAAATITTTTISGGTIAGVKSKKSHSKDQKKDGDEDVGSEEDENDDQIKQINYLNNHDNDQWDSARFSNPQPFSDDDQSTRNRILSASIISNPTPFGFDDRFDASIRTFPQRFADSGQDVDYVDGFDDDFKINEAEEEVSNRGESTSNSTPKPTRSITGGKRIDINKEEEKVADNEEEEEEWGEFSSAENANELITKNDNSSTIVGVDKIGHVDDEASWNDFDLLVDQSTSSSDTTNNNNIVDTSRALRKPKLVYSNLISHHHDLSDPSDPPSANDLINP